MFIYEKNKRNSETGKTEQTLNITFEGNKPVENPDVIVTKDGITGIKSDPVYVAFSSLNPAYNVYDYITSFSADGEILDNTVFPEVPTSFNRYFGFNLKDVQNNSASIVSIAYYNTNFNSVEYLDFLSDDIISDEKYITGEYVFDVKECILTKPNGTTTNYADSLSGFNIIGMRVGY